MLRFPAPLLLAIVFLAGSIGCNASEGDPDVSGVPFYSVPEDTFRATGATREEALTLLQNLNTQALRRAFERLPTYQYTIHTRTEQISALGGVTAAVERLVRHTRGSASLIRSDTIGAFDFGPLGRFAEADLEADLDFGDLPGNPAARILPEDPAYLAPRYREAYRYRLLPDTMFGGRPLHVIEVRARPQAEDDPEIRYARFYATQDGTVVGFDLIRVARPWLFHEASRFSLRLRPAPNGAWVPHRTRFRTRFHLPFRPPQQFRVTRVYSDYAIAGGG